MPKIKHALLTVVKLQMEVIKINGVDSMAAPPYSNCIVFYVLFLPGLPQ